MRFLQNLIFSMFITFLQDITELDWKQQEKSNFTNKGNILACT